MTVELEKVSGIKTRLTVTIDADAVAAEREKVIKVVRRDAKVRGFRPGKAPLSMITRQYGEYIDEEIRHNLVGEAIGKAVEENDIKIAATPELEKSDFNEDGTLTAVALLETIPEVELGDYKNVEIAREKVNVLEAAIDGRIDMLRQQHVTVTELEDRDVCESGDHVRIDFVGRKDGEAFRGGSHEGYLLELGSNTFIPGFEDGVIGMKVGETKNVDVTFPEGDSRNDLAGQVVVFEVTLKAIVRRDLPEVDDEFAKDAGMGETAAELRQKIRDDIQEAEEARTRRAARKNMIAKLVEMHDVEVPQAMVERQLEYMVRAYKIDLAMAGIPIKSDPQADEQLKQRMVPSAKEEVQSYFIFKAIAEAEGLEVTEEEIEAKLTEIAERQGRPVAEVSAHYQKENMIDSLKDEMLDEKVVDFLLEHAKITWEEPTEASDDEVVDAEIEPETDAGDSEPEAPVGDESKDES